MNAKMSSAINGYLSTDNHRKVTLTIEHNPL